MNEKQLQQAPQVLIAAEADASNGFHFLKMLTGSRSSKHRMESWESSTSNKELIRPLRCRSTSATSATTTTATATTMSLFDLLNPLREVLDTVDLDLDDLDHTMKAPHKQDDSHSCSSTSSYSHVSLEIQGHDVSPLASPNMISRPLRLANMPPHVVPPLHKTTVSFAASVEVKEIPSHRDLPPEDKVLLWDELDVATANIQRNYHEFQVDGWDWRRATEEPAFCRSPLALEDDDDDDDEEEDAKLVHPATWMVQLQEQPFGSRPTQPDWDQSSRRGRSPPRSKRHRKPHHVLRPHRIDFPKQRSAITGQPLLLPPYNKTKAKQKTHKLHQPSRPTTSISNNKKPSATPPTPQTSWSVKPKNLISSPNHPMQEVQLQQALLQHHRHKHPHHQSIWRHHHPSKQQLPLPTQLFLPSDLDPTPAVLLPSSSSSLTTSPSPSPRHHHHHVYSHRGPHHHYDHWKRYSW